MISCIWCLSVLSLFIFAVMMDVVTEEVANEEHAPMYADDLVLICETKEKTRRRFEARRNALESKGLKVNTSMTKVMCELDVIPKEAAEDPCSVCGKRVGVNSIHCMTCDYWVHGRYSGMQGSLVRVAQGFVCSV